MTVTCKQRETEKYFFLLSKELRKQPKTCNKIMTRSAIRLLVFIVYSSPASNDLTKLFSSVYYKCNYTCGLSTATIEYSSLSVCLCVCLSVCLSVYTITQKIMVQLT